MIELSEIIDRLDRLCSSPGPEDDADELELDWANWLESLSFEDLPNLMQICKKQRFPSSNEILSTRAWKQYLIECLSAAGGKKESDFLQLVHHHIYDSSIKTWLIASVPDAIPKHCLQWLKQNCIYLNEDEARDYIGRLYSHYRYLNSNEIDEIRLWCVENGKQGWLEPLNHLKKFFLK